MREIIKPMPVGHVPAGFFVTIDTNYPTAVMLESRWSRQPEHLSTAIHRYDLKAPKHCAALGLVHPDFAQYLGLTRLQCLQGLGVISKVTTLPLDDIEYLVIDHLADCVKHNRMACRYPYMTLKADDDDCRLGWVYTKYVPHSLESYVEVMAPELAIYGTLRPQKQRWRGDWIGPLTTKWPRDLYADLLDYDRLHGTSIFDKTEYDEFVANQRALGKSCKTLRNVWYMSA